MVITVHFHGGPLDGKTVSGRDGDQEEAERYYLLTHHGRRGQRFRVASDYAVERIAEEGLEKESHLLIVPPGKSHSGWVEFRFASAE